MRQQGQLGPNDLDASLIEGGLSAGERQLVLDRAAERAGLTDLQKEIVRLLVFTSLVRKQIAKSMTMAKNTLDTHVGRLFRRLDVEDRVDLVRCIYERSFPALVDHATSRSLRVSCSSETRRADHVR